MLFPDAALTFTGKVIDFSLVATSLDGDFAGWPFKILNGSSSFLIDALRRFDVKWLASHYTAEVGEHSFQTDRELARLVMSMWLPALYSCQISLKVVALAQVKCECRNTFSSLCTIRINIEHGRTGILMMMLLKNQDRLATMSWSNELA